MERAETLRRVFHPRPSVIILLVVVALLVAVRLALPSFVTHYVNQVLNDMPGHTGEVESIDIHLWRGAYSIHKVRVDEVDENKVTPLFNAQDVDISIEWGELVRGHLVGEISFINPHLNIVSVPEKKEAKKQKFKIEDLVRRFKSFAPLQVNRFNVTNGEIHFRDVNAQPPADIFIDQVNMAALNLTNSDSVANDLWATVSATGRAMGSGTTKLEMRLNPNEPRPTFDLAFELQHLRLTALNDYLKYYLSVVARDGELSLYAESKARDGRFTGYAKPIVKNLDILQLKKERKTAGEVIQGIFAKILAAVFKNKPHEQIATRVEFSGSLENPDVGVWDAAVEFIRNAFVQALRPGLEASVAPRQAQKAERSSPNKRPDKSQDQPPADR